MTVPKLNGVFSVLKPPSMTSAECCNIIKASLLEVLQLRPDTLKIGHGGTLDKDATGVLATGVGYGCKHLTKLLHGPKVLCVQLLQSNPKTICKKGMGVKCWCKTMLGIETDTYYITGQKVNEKPFDHVTKELIDHTVKKFVGTNQQVPPIYSALKYKGRRLSDLAYAGEAIPLEKLQPRTVDVFDIKCVHIKLPSFTLDISCGSGFYVRSLIRDLTNEMNTCAYIDKLERTKHGCFTKEHSLPQSQWNYASIKTSINFYRFHHF